ncbi:ParA family protein [Nonomuraea sp. NPDC050547]|uniref:ParA family protein n=1 Tax=Nonomuraea sp. NPDC050547 TaxID=3364368 RepID=UPI00378E8043
MNATAQSGALRTAARAARSYLIPIINGKGGVGKTMLTLGLAAHTAKANGRALVWDTDPQGTAHQVTNVLADPGYEVRLDTDPDHIEEIRSLQDIDTVFADCPGSLEADKILARIVKNATFVLIPYDHEFESVLPTIRTAKRVAEMGVPYAAVVTKADPQVGAQHVLEAWETLEAENIPHFRSFVRKYRAWPNSLKAGIPITRYNERYAPKLREDLAAVHTELLLNIGRAGARR